MFHRSHHHSNMSVALGPAEPRRKIRCQLKVLFRGSCRRGLQHHVASRTFLGMKPEITGPSLTQADPFVLAVVSSHLNQQSIL